MSRVCVVVVLLTLAILFAPVSGRELNLQEEWAVRESLGQVHPRLRGQWLADRGLDNSYYTTFRKPESTGLREVGRWPWGPSWELCGRDSLLFLGSGSGVRILSVTDSVNPRMLGQIVARGLVSQLVVRDSLLFVACGGWGAQVYSVSDPANPRELGSMDAVIGDLAVVDTFCYTLGGDSLKVYSIADPTRPARLGAVRDGGGVIAVSNGYAFSGGFSTMNVFDVRNPAAPTWIASRGGSYLALAVRGPLLACSGIQPSYFTLLDVSVPSAIRQLGSVGGYGGEGIYFLGRYAYLSCAYDHKGLHIIDIADSTAPVLRGNYESDGSEHYDVYVEPFGRRSFIVAWYGGLSVADVTNPDAPTEIWTGYGTFQAVDVDVDGDRAYIADGPGGLRIVDVSNAGRPIEIGLYDTTGVREVTSAVARDSFAFCSRSGSQRRFLRVLDVSEPSTPALVAAESCYNAPQDMVLRDSLLYCAEMNRFQIFNVARPREPVLVGSCVIGAATDLTLTDTLAFASRNIVNVADPSNPISLGTFPVGGNGNAVLDTFVYQPAAYDSLVVFSVANPLAPRRITSLVLSGGHIWNAGVVLVDTLLHIGGDILHIVSVTDPALPREVGTWRPPYDIRRLHYDGQYFYAACYDAGVCVLESSLTGVTEPRAGTGKPLRGLRVWPTPTSGPLLHVAGGDRLLDGRLALRDATGRQVRPEAKAAAGAACSIDIGSLPAGVYFVEHRSGNRRQTVKFIKR
ncbi:MAG: T9SS type A sorting domain-containing protein [bacterium]